MKLDKTYLSSLIKKAVKAPFKHPWVFLPGAALLVSNYVIFEILRMINLELNTKTLFFIGMAASSLVFLAITAFFGSGLIGLCFDLHKGKHTRNFLNYSYNFWFRNFIILVLGQLISVGITLSSTLIAEKLGKQMMLSTQNASMLYIFILALGFFGIFCFFSLSNVFSVCENRKAFSSLMKSASFVSKNYFLVAAVLLVVLLGYFWIGKIRISFIRDMLFSIVLPPFFIMFLV